MSRRMKLARALATVYGLRSLRELLCVQKAVLVFEAPVAAAQELAAAQGQSALGRVTLSSALAALPAGLKLVLRRGPASLKERRWGPSKSQSRKRQKD
jgi:hypothetical protein